MPNSIPLVHTAPSGSTRARIAVRPGVRREVKIILRTAEQGIAHRATDQVQLVPGRPEKLAQAGGDRVDRDQIARVAGGGHSAG